MSNANYIVWSFTVGFMFDNSSIFDYILKQN